MRHIYWKEAWVCATFRKQHIEYGYVEIAVLIKIEHFNNQNVKRKIIEREKHTLPDPQKKGSFKKLSEFLKFKRMDISLINSPKPRSKNKK